MVAPGPCSCRTLAKTFRVVIGMLCSVFLRCNRKDRTKGRCIKQAEPFSLYSVSFAATMWRTARVIKKKGRSARGCVRPGGDKNLLQDQSDRLAARCGIAAVTWALRFSPRAN